MPVSLYCNHKADSLTVGVNYDSFHDCRFEFLYYQERIVADFGCWELNVIRTYECWLNVLKVWGVLLTRPL